MNELSRSELQDAIQQKVVECVKLGIAKLGIKSHPVDLRFDKKGVTAGCASWNDKGEYSLNFNLELSYQNQEETLTVTVQHEVAHILDYWMHDGKGDSGHGANWGYVMGFVFGLRPDIYHTMNTSSVKRVEPRIHKYECPTCGRTSFHTTREKNQVAYYTCRLDNTRMNYKGIDLLGAK